jgi:undecaprenyl-diphosphatase
MTLLQAVLLALVQGITELFPISSLGHAVILPAVLGWPIDESTADFLPFLVVMHLGTAVALLAYFWRTWWDLGTSLLWHRDSVVADQRRLLGNLVVATIPAVIVGFALERVLKAAFAVPALSAAFLIGNGVMLFAAERLRHRQNAASLALAELGWRQALLIGFAQCLALVPGFSRSGATMAGGYLTGLSHEDAARFSFLAATPIILGATVLEAPKLLHHGAHLGSAAVVAGVVAGLAAFISTAVLMRWFRGHEVKGFDPFAVYCVLAGAASLALLISR